METVNTLATAPAVAEFLIHKGWDGDTGQIVVCHEQNVSF